MVTNYAHMLLTHALEWQRFDTHSTGWWKGVDPKGVVGSTQ
jgi:hypothetical protein